jgi:flagellar basal body-associated protein FliL
MRGDNMKTGFIILIAIVFIVTITFGIIISRHFAKFEKKALELKERKDAYIKELEEQKARIEALGGIKDEETAADKAEPEEKQEN